MTESPAIASDEAAAHARSEWCQEVLNTAPDRFAAGRQIARRLGAIVEGDRVEFGFWTPELQDWRIADGDVFLEILRPRGEIDLTASQADVTLNAGQRESLINLLDQRQAIIDRLIETHLARASLHGLALIPW